MAVMENLGVRVVKHPLAQVALTRLRDKDTKPGREFGLLSDQVAAILAVEATRELYVRSIGVETPLARATGCELGEPLILVPVLRAGLGLVNAFCAILPEVCVHHLGIRRDEATAKPESYLAQSRAINPHARVLLVDPMLASGGSACVAIDQIKAAGGIHIKLVCVVAAPEGITAVQNKHPDVEIITVAVDDHLNERKYIVPGLGDYGDRLFGTC